MTRDDVAHATLTDDQLIVVASMPQIGRDILRVCLKYSSAEIA